MISFTELWGKSFQQFSNPAAEKQPRKSDQSWRGTPVTDTEHRSFSRKDRALQPSGSDPLERENIRWSFILWQYILSPYTVTWELPRNPPLKDLIDSRLKAKTDGQELHSPSKVLCYRQKHSSQTQTKTLDSLLRINKYFPAHQNTFESAFIHSNCWFLQTKKT